MLSVCVHVRAYIFNMEDECVKALVIFKCEVNVFPHTAA